ncbi:MAG: restriction endonuclease subunit S [Saprospiraceae bacterium]|nr:restriction endonuclease subunit S [Saprospiraceae bacterium]
METKKKDNALYGGEIPEGWEIGPVASVVKKIISGVSVNGEERAITENEFGVLKVSSVSYDFFDPNEYKVINQKEIVKAKVNPEAGTVIMSRANTPELVGANVLITENYPNLFLSDKLWQIKVKSEKFDIVWFSYLLKLDVVKKTISGNATGSSKSMRNITQESFLLTPCILPPHPEQRAIAACLSTWDCAIQKTTHLIAQKELHKQWLMQQLLTGKKRLKGFDGAWKEVRMKDSFQFIKSYSIPRDGLSKSEIKDHIYCIHYGDIHAQYETVFLDFAAQEKIPKIIDKHFLVQKKDYLKNGDIVMADASEDHTGIGEAVEIINLERKIAVGGLHTIVLRDFVNATVPGFRAYLFASEKVRNELRKKATGTSVYSVTKSTLENLVITIPNLPEQTAIAHILQTADQELQLLKAKVEKIKEQKKGMMQVLLTGKKRLKI